MALGDTIDFGVVVITDFDDLVSKCFGDIAGTLGVLFCYEPSFFFLLLSAKLLKKTLAFDGSYFSENEFLS